MKKSAVPRPVLAFVLIALFAVGTGPELRAASSSTVSYNRDVRPILSQHCFACHGPDEKTRKAGLRLDDAAAARAQLRSGNFALVPGEPHASELYARIISEDADERMPPDETKKPLTQAQIEILKTWIAEGAEYESHWAYITPEKPELPKVNDASWPRNGIDHFILHKLEKEGVRPSPEAPREKLLRRVTLDLTGLPPSVEEIDAFLADPDPNAYEKVVDRLLMSPHYGERMAQQWLDLARYGETQGYHHDRHRDMWHWRDWVIRAFNENKPFDEFTIEQLAGDLLPNPTRDQLIATGFHRNEMTTSEGGALPEEYIVKYAVGRVDTTARVWLGTSMACAECHDHKYDPITQREYYQFFAFFFDTPEHGLDREELNPIPRITLETPEQAAQAEKLDRELATLEKAEQLVLSAPNPEWDEGQATWAQQHREQNIHGTSLLTPRNSSRTEVTAANAEAGTDSGAVEPGHSFAIGELPRTEPTPSTAAYEVSFHTQARSLNGLRLELLPTEQASGTNTTAEPLFTGIETTVRSLDPESEIANAGSLEPGNWWVVGPFKAGSAREALDREFGPEKGFDPGATFEPGKLQWQERGASDNDEVFSVSEKSSALYATRILRVDEPRIVEAELTTDAGVRVWLNDRQLLSQAPPSAEAKEKTSSRRILLWLRAGENRLTMKLVRGGDDVTARLHVEARPVTSAAVKWMASASSHSGKHNASGLVDDNPETGWAPGPAGSEPHVVYLATEDSFGFRTGTEIKVRFLTRATETPPAIGRASVSAISSTNLGEFVRLPQNILNAISREPGELTEAQRNELRVYYRTKFVPEVEQTRQLLAAKRKERDDYRNSWPTAMVMQKADPMRVTHIRIRGQYDNLGERVDPGVPEQLFPWIEGLPRNRLGMAKWLTHPKHPLTARVTVNQYWQRLFGTGLVKTSEDFGAQGEWPSHLELLDWLATEFIDSGWNVKAIQRLMVTSATYRQDSVVSRELLERDPENRWLARGPRFRLDAENIRDLAMTSSGLLNPKIGGPSVFPYQPPGLWGQVSFEGTRDYVQSEGADNYRRGLYTYWRRSIPYASFTIFDAPSREVCVPRRPRTNTPLQALALLNDPVYIEAARALGQRVLAEGGSSFDTRIRFAFRLVLGRPPSAREHDLMAAALQRELERFSNDRESANRLIHVGASAPPVEVDIAELAAWTVLGNTLLNLDEAITRG